MQSRTGVPLRVIAEPRPQPAIPSAVLAVSMFVFSEAMLFAGLISAFSITRASAVLGIVGAGGIGFELMAALRLIKYDEVSAILLSVLACVLVVDGLGATLRRRLK